MIKVLLVDDEPNALEALSRLLKIYHPEICICGCCGNLTEAVAAIASHAPNLVFLDVELGKESGFELFKHFPKPDFKVIFSTAYEHYAVQAFRFAALDYLPKPVNPKMLSEALAKASELLDRVQTPLKVASYLHNLGQVAGASKKIVLKTAESVHLVALGDIVYCEADGGYTNFYLADKSRIMVSSTIGGYEQLLQEYGFFRIHQSYLLNLGYFKRYEKADGGKAVLKNATSLPVATRKKELLLQKLATL